MSYSKINEFLKVGDYVYYGRGTEENPSKAAYHYRIAAEHGGNGQGEFYRTRGFLKIPHFLERILMEHKDPNRSLDSKLLVYYPYSSEFHLKIEILSKN